MGDRAVRGGKERSRLTGLLLGLVLAVPGLASGQGAQPTAAAGPAAAATPAAGPAGVTAEDQAFVQQAYDLARQAREKGNHPFGAVLACPGGVVLTAENTVTTDRDPSRHAELNVLVQAAGRIPAETRRSCTLYASAAPCPVCCASVFVSGVERVVYGVSYAAFQRVSGHPTRITCPDLFRTGGRTLTWVGPVLEEVGVSVFSPPAGEARRTPSP